MERQDLIGTWKLVRYGPMPTPQSVVMELRDDGTAVTRTQTGTGALREESQRWRYVDRTHWNMEITIPPSPDVPGLEDGAGELVKYKVTRFSHDEMDVTQFDYEFAFTYQRMKA
jgi:hypothetical protein